MSSHGLAWGLALLLGLVLCIPSRAQEADDGAELDPEEVITIAIQEDGIPIADFIDHASQETGKVFILGPKVIQQLETGRNRSVKITNRIRVKRKHYFETFKLILQTNDLFAFPAGDPEANLFIVEDLSNTAAKNAIKTRSSFVPEEDLEEWRYKTDVISTVIDFEHMDASRAKSDLQQIVNTREAGAVTTIPGVNSIIITEFAPTVYYVAQMLKRMDLAEERFNLEFAKIRLDYADPEELQPIIADLLETEDDLFGGTQQRAPRGRTAASGVPKAPPAKIIPDGRTNSLIVYAIPEDLEQIRDLVNKLDEEVKTPIPDIWQYQLKHAVADEVAETLNEVVEASTGSRRLSGRTQTGQRSQQGVTGFVDQQIVIVPEDHTNSLLIRASGTQYQWLAELLEEIDRRLPQVLIEAAIVELSEDFSTSFGVELASLDLADDPNADITRGFGFTGFGITDFIDQDGDGIPELRLPSLDSLASGGFTGGIFRFPGFQVPFILNAIGTDNQSNLLSIPSVLTNDNASATITVSESQTTTTSSLAGGGVSQGGFGGFEEAPLTLSISPHISADDYLRLDIELLVENFTGSEREVAGQVIPAPKTTRELLASVTVPNNATVVIGGLTQKLITEDRTKVPFLGDLPLIGALFRNTNKSERKTTLYLFVTPHILEDETFDDLYDLTYQRELEVEALIGDNINLFDPQFQAKKTRRKALERAGLAPTERDLLDIPRYRSPTEAPPVEEPDEIPVEGEKPEIEDPPVPLTDDPPDGDGSDGSGSGAGGSGESSAPGSDEATEGAPDLPEEAPREAPGRESRDGTDSAPTPDRSKRP